MTLRSNDIDNTMGHWRMCLALAVCMVMVGGLALPDALASDLNSFRVAQLVVADRPPARPTAALALGQEVRFRTTVDVKLERVVVRLGSRSMFDYPFLLWVVDSVLPDLSPMELQSLKSYLVSGGFILVDNAGEGQAMHAIDRQFRSLVERLFPDKRLEPVPSSHVLMRTFYKLDQAPGRRVVKPVIEGVVLEGRIALLYSMNDLAGAWSRDAFGNYEFEALPGGPSQRESAIMLGVNVVMYALLLDYKDEQAHVEYLLKKRRLRPEDVNKR